MSDCVHGDAIGVYDLINKPHYIIYCTITEYENGFVFLDWKGKHVFGETGFFRTMRACKMYVTKRLCTSKSLWENKNDQELLDLLNDRK